MIEIRIKPEPPNQKVLAIFLMIIVTLLGLVWLIGTLWPYILGAIGVSILCLAGISVWSLHRAFGANKVKDEW